MDQSEHIMQFFSYSHLPPLLQAARFSRLPGRGLVAGDVARLIPKPRLVVTPTN